MNRALILFVALVSAAGCSSADSGRAAPSEGGADTSTATDAGAKDSTASTEGGVEAQAADAPQGAPSDDVDDFGKGKDGAAMDAADGAVALTGKLKWAKGFGTTGNTEALSAAVDPSGNALTTGFFTETADFGGGPVTCASPTGTYCSFVTKYSARGAFIWAQTFAASDGVASSFVGSDSSGNVYLLGGFYGTVDFGTRKLSAPGNHPELFAAKLDKSGSLDWVKAFGTHDYPCKPGGSTQAAVDMSGNFTLAGGFKGPLDFGGGVLSGTGKNNLYVVRLTTKGAYDWGEVYDGTGTTLDVNTVSIDPSGNIVIGGSLSGSINFGGGTLKSGGPSLNAYLAKFSSSGAYSWAHVFSDGAGDETTGVGTDAAGDIFATGTFGGSVDLGSGTLNSAGGSDVFLAKLDAAGSGIWSQSFGDANDQVGGPLAVDGQGNVTIGGGCYAGTLDFWGGTLTCNGSGTDTALFVSTFTGLGAYGWAFTGGSTVSGSLTLGIGGNSDVVLGGFFHDTLKIAKTSLTAPAGATAAFVALFSP